MQNRFLMGRLFAVALVAVIGLWAVSQDAVAQSRRMTKADVEAWVTELSNWGRWGNDDQLGALNLITPEKRKQAAGVVKEGISVSLARNVEKQEAADNPQPFVHKMRLSPDSPWAVDIFTIDFHGYAHTHMDSLCHLFYKGKMYNGFLRKDVTLQGADKLSIHNVKGGIFTRGILIDIPRLRGVKYLDPASPIYPEELLAWENRAGLRVSSGDVVFIRTGRWARRDAMGPWNADTEGMAGLHVSCAKWLKQRDVAMLGSDAASDVMPSGVPGMSHPVHLLALHAMGIHIFDNCDLEQLGQVSERLKRWEFLITAAPVPVNGGTGSPLNPIATF